jgi:RNA polymerase sigma-70 factor (sigma-E family)
MERTQQQRRSPDGEQLEWGAPAQRPAHGERPFEEFYRLEMPRLVALARSLCGGGAADDVAQEAMLSAYRHWHRVSEMDWPEAYVRRTCANLAVSHVRRGVVELRALARLAARRSPPVEIEEPAGEFWSAVRALPPRQAQVVALHYVCDLSVAEVAATLELHVGTVKTHLSRAREQLAHALGPIEEQP